MDAAIEYKPRFCLEFEVEKIIGVSDDGNYQVQWAPAWVSKFHLVGCEHLIQEFLQEQLVINMKAESVSTLEEQQQAMPNTIFNQTGHHFETEPETTQGKSNDQTSNLSSKTELTEFGTDLETYDIAIGDFNQSSDNGGKTFMSTLRNTSVEGSFEYQPSERTSKNLLPEMVDGNSIQNDSISNLQSNKLQNINHKEISPESQLNVLPEQCHKKCFQCPHCSAKFMQESVLARHILLHTEEHYFPCPHCNKNFHNRFRLKMHIRSHTGERLFSCDHCNYTCSSRSALKTHMRTHTGEKPYRCDICDKSFSQSCSLSKHIRIHTGVKPYTCGQCGKTFSDSSSRNRHVLRCSKKHC